MPRSAGTPAKPSTVHPSIEIVQDIIFLTTFCSESLVLDLLKANKATGLASAHRASWSIFGYTLSTIRVPAPTALIRIGDVAVFAARVSAPPTETIVKAVPSQHRAIETFSDARNRYLGYSLLHNRILQLEPIS